MIKQNRETIAYNLYNFIDYMNQKDVTETEIDSVNNIRSHLSTSDGIKDFIQYLIQISIGLKYDADKITINKLKDELENLLLEIGIDRDIEIEK